MAPEMVLPAAGLTIAMFDEVGGRELALPDPDEPEDPDELDPDEPEPDPELDPDEPDPDPDDDPEPPSEEEPDPLLTPASLYIWTTVGLLSCQ